NELDLNSGRRRRLLKNVRTGDLVVNPKDQAIWGVQHHNGHSILVTIPPPYDRWRPVLTLDYGRDIFDLDISPDGKTLSASMIDYHYTAKGFAPVRLPIEVRNDLSAIDYLGQQVVEKHPIVKEWNAGSPARVNLDEVTTYAGPYHPFARVRFGSVYPVVEGYKTKIAAGLRFNASDPLGLRSFDATVAVSPSRELRSDERLHAKIEYDGVPWKVRLGYNATDFYDLFGPTRVSRKGELASVSYH